MAEFDQEVKKLDARQVEIDRKVERLLAERDQNQQHRAKLVEQRAEAVKANQTGLYNNYTEFQEHQKSKALMAKVEARQAELQKQAEEKKLAGEKAIKEQNKKKFDDLLTNVKRYWKHYVACHKYLDLSEDCDTLDACEKLSLKNLEEKWKRMNGVIHHACDDHYDDLWKTDEKLACPNINYCTDYDCRVNVKGLREYGFYFGKTSVCECEVKFDFCQPDGWWLNYDLENDTVLELGWLKKYD